MADAFATANGHALNSVKIHIPRQGVWHGDLALSGDDALDVPLLVNINGVEFHGQGSRVSVYEGTGLAHFSGGRGGFGRPITPKAYQNVPVSIPLNDILSAAGEELSSSADPNVLNQQLARWTTMGGTAGNALAALVDSLDDVHWRVLIDGRLWIGKETWPEMNPDGQVLVEDIVGDSAILYFEEPSLIPGTSFRGRHVSYVEHSLDGEDSSLRTHVWFET